MPNLPPTPADPTTAGYCTEVAGAGAANVSLHLFTNDYTPNPPDAVGSFVEPTIPEYAPVPGGDWLGPFLTPDEVPYFQSPIRRFLVPRESGSVAAIRGAYLTINTGGVLSVLDAVRFQDVYTLQSGADALSLAPTLYLSVLPPAMMGERRGITAGLQALLAAQIQRVGSARTANRFTWTGLRRAKLQHLLTMLDRLASMDSREVIQSDAEGRVAYLIDGTPDVDAALGYVRQYAQAALAAKGQ